jgi:hypothetical protein
MENLSETLKRKIIARKRLRPRKRWRPALKNRDASGAVILESRHKKIHRIDLLIKNVTIIIDDLYDSLPKSLLIKYRESLRFDRDNL